MMLAPVVITLGLLAARRARAAGGSAEPGQGADALVRVRLHRADRRQQPRDVPGDVKAIIVPATTFLLTMALAAMGLETDIRKLRARGVRPFLLGVAAFGFISGFSLVLIELVYTCRDDPRAAPHLRRRRRASARDAGARRR